MDKLKPILFPLLAEVLRADGQTIAGESWAEDARAWAVAQGVSDGTNPDGTVTREELVTMLYRYIGSPAMNVPELGLIGNYPDSAAVSACPSTVATAAPIMPHLQTNRKTGSRMIFTTAPASVESMAKRGLPSARITGFMACPNI